MKVVDIFAHACYFKISETTIASPWNSIESQHLQQVVWFQVCGNIVCVVCLSLRHNPPHSLCSGKERCTADACSSCSSPTHEEYTRGSVKRLVAYNSKVFVPCPWPPEIITCICAAAKTKTGNVSTVKSLHHILFAPTGSHAMTTREKKSLNTRSTFASNAMRSTHHAENVLKKTKTTRMPLARCIYGRKIRIAIQSTLSSALSATSAGYGVITARYCSGHASKFKKVICLIDRFTRLYIRRIQAKRRSTQRKTASICIISETCADHPLQRVQATESVPWLQASQPL